MIYINPVGGLGNMFFHIASIWTLAKDNDDELYLLNIENKIQSLINDTRCNLKHAINYNYLFSRFNKKDGLISKRVSYPFNYIELEYKIEHEYVGYFQSEKYFKHRKSEIIELLKPDNSFINQIKNYSNLFDNISLHVRRNDYVTLYPNIHPPQTIEYYNKAMSILPKDLKVVIFSDDLNWCRENFIGDRFIFINEIDYVSIYIMCKMKYHIIANSSFSWWGAWMSNAEKVIAPKHWFGNNSELSNEDLIPNNWIRI